MLLRVTPAVTELCARPRRAPDARPLQA